jgi:hypothetical protein
VWAMIEEEAENSNNFNNDQVILSIAISLKRIADSLELLQDAFVLPDDDTEFQS